MNRLFSLAMLTLFACFIAINTQAQSRNTDKITEQDILEAVNTYIQRHTDEQSGYFTFSASGKEVKDLKLLKIHSIKLDVKDKSSYSACVDMVASNADLYDLDFSVSHVNKELKVRNIDLHKYNSQPRYVWKKGENGAWYKIAEAEAPTELLGVLGKDKDKFTFRYEVKLPELKYPSKLWIPLAQGNRFQDVEIISMNIPGEKQIIQDSAFKNTVLYLELQPNDGKSSISIQYKVKRKEKTPYAVDKPNLEKYLQSTPLLPVGGKFAEIDKEIFEETGASTPLAKAKAIYQYIIDNMRYNKQGEYGTGNADYACNALTGNCTEFHSFFISLARSAGIPARFFVGASIPAQKNSGSIGGYHCWAEFYADGQWWPVDISEADKYDAMSAYYFGHNPSNRIQISAGRDLKLNPAPQSCSINYFFYPILEEAGARKLVETEFSFERVLKES